MKIRTALVQKNKRLPLYLETGFDQKNCLLCCRCWGGRLLNQLGGGLFRSVWGWSNVIKGEKSSVGPFTIDISRLSWRCGLPTKLLCLTRDCSWTGGEESELSLLIGDWDWDTYWEEQALLLSEELVDATSFELKTGAHWYIASVGSIAICTRLKFLKI